MSENVQTEYDPTAERVISSSKPVNIFGDVPENINWDAANQEPSKPDSREDSEEDVETADAQEAEDNTTDSTKEEEETPENDELATLEKRYKDLQSYSDKRINAISSQLEEQVSLVAELRSELASAKSVPLKPTLSDEELDNLSKDFPNVDKLAEARAMKIIEQHTQPLIDKIDTLEKELGRNQEQQAKAELRKLHPDFEKIENDPVFLEWYGMQPAEVKQLFASKRVAAVAKGLDMYKHERGIKSVSEKKKEASKAVDTKTTTTTGKGKPAKTPLSTVRATIKKLQGSPTKLADYMEKVNKWSAEGLIDNNT